MLEIQAHLAEDKVKVAASSVFRFLRHLGPTCKKVLHAAEQDRPEDAAMRRRWRRGQRKLDPRRLVFIDETAISASMTRRGRAFGVQGPIRFMADSDDGGCPVP